MARRQKHEEHENHERWLVSYADFITLLFAFFVVMYSISSVNEGKYRVLSSSIVSAFNKPAKSLDPIQYGTDLRAPILQHKIMKEEDRNAHERVGVDYQVMPTAQELANMQKIADEVKHDLQALVDEGLVEVNKTNKGLEIEIKSEILFASGTARLSATAQSALKQIAKILAKQENQIHVEGFTDDVPISTETFPSNWELSAARSASVVHLFTKSGIAPERLAAIGYAEFKPIAPNLTETGRRKNRRVAIMVLNQAEADRVRIDDRTKEEKEADARRKLMKSFGSDPNQSDTGPSSKEIKPLGLDKRTPPASNGGIIQLPATPKSSSGIKPIVLGGPKVIGGSTSNRSNGNGSTTASKSAAPIRLPTSSATTETSSSANNQANEDNKARPTIIQLPQPTVLPAR